MRYNVLSRKDLLFLNSLGKELGTEVSFNLLSNEYINYITKDSPQVYIPSKLYILDNNAPDLEAVRFPAEPFVENQTNAECSLFVSADILSDALSILKKIQEWLKVSLSLFCIQERIPSMAAQNTIFQCKEKEAMLLKGTLRLNENTTLFSVKNHNLLQKAFNHMAMQLKGCVNLRHLIFSNMQQFLPMKLGDAITTLKSLLVVNLELSQVTLTSGHAIMKGLSQCQSLRELYLAHCVLTDCLNDLLGGVNHVGFPYLLVLGLQHTKLCENDVKAIASAAKRHQIIQLKSLLLSGITLTNYIEKLVPRHHPGFQSLELLTINSTKISPSDTTHLIRAIHLNKFPVLKHLDVSHNYLTGQITELLPNIGGPGFLSLEGLNVSTTKINKADLKSLAQALSRFETSKAVSLHLIGNELTGILDKLLSEVGLPSVYLLDLQRTKLNKKDIISLSKAVQEGKLPHLRKLFLFGNNLSGKEAVIKHFLQTCTRHFRGWLLEIRISLDNLPSVEDFKKEISSLCQGTSVSVNWTEVKIYANQATEVSFGGSFPYSSGSEHVSFLLPSFEPQIPPLFSHK